MDTILLDKTGTVTTGEMSLATVTVAEGGDRDEALRLTGAIEDASRAPDRPGDRRRCPPRLTARRGCPPVDGLRRTGGQRRHRPGRRPRDRGRQAVPARRAGLDIDDALAAALSEAQSRGQTAIAARLGRPRPGRVRGRRLGQAGLGRGRSGSCRELGLEPVLLTGDNDATARAVAAEIGIDR